MVYCTPLSVKFLSQIKFGQLEFETDADYEGFLEEMVIPQAQKVVDSYCNHDFNSHTGGTITLDGNGKDTVFLKPEYCPMQSLTSVSIGGTSKTVSDFKVYDRYVTYDGGTFTEDVQNVVFVADYGYSEVPADVEFVAAAVGANMIREMVRSKMMPDLIMPTLQAEDIQSLKAVFASPRIFTRELKELLQKYCYEQVEVG